MLNRRGFISSAAALLATPRIAFAGAETERRFVFIIQRGAADGLHTLIPYADPAYARLRGALAIDPGEALKLDGTFALHPSLTGIADLYKAGQASLFHAVASPYRDRSHFDAQNVLETGGKAPFDVKDGWMNRLAGMLPRRSNQAIAFAPTLPLALRGAIDVASYAPSSLPHANDDLLLRVQKLYEGDAQLSGLWSTALKAQGMAGAAASGKGQQSPVELGKVAAGFLARTDGPRIAMIETNGWDTHSAQKGRMATQAGAWCCMGPDDDSCCHRVWTHRRDKWHRRDRPWDGVSCHADWRCGKRRKDCRGLARAGRGRSGRQSRSQADTRPECAGSARVRPSVSA
jgi:uncharacterized protein (DUF1501 family)